MGFSFKFNKLVFMFFLIASLTYLYSSNYRLKSMGITGSLTLYMYIIHKIIWKSGLVFLS